MTNEVNGEWLSILKEGGLPQILLGPAGNAISRLIGTSIEIPASYIDGFSQRIKDKNEAKSKLFQALANKAIDYAIDEPENVKRVLNSIVSKELKREQNKIAVSKIALMDLLQRSPPDGGVEPSEQFMTNFERAAEDAVEPDIRTMFGKLLAGEIRTPNSVSAATMNFVSLLDAEVATAINRVFSSCWMDVAILNTISPLLTVADSTYLEQVGFWTAGRSVQLIYDEQGTLIKLPRKEKGFVALGEQGSYVNFDIAILSKAGRELLNILDPPYNFDAMGLYFQQKGATKFYSGRCTYLEGGVSVSFDVNYY